MQQFTQFVLSHWMLWTLFVIILALLAFYELRNQVGGVRKIQPKDLVQLMNKENAVVIDIRAKDTFKDGHIIGSQNILANDLSEKSNKLQKFKNKSLVFVCNNGQQSLKSAIQVRRQGFEQVFCLQGGITAWRNASLPLTKPK